MSETNVSSLTRKTLRQTKILREIIDEVKLFCDQHYINYMTLEFETSSSGEKNRLIKGQVPKQAQLSVTIAHNLDRSPGSTTAVPISFGTGWHEDRSSKIFTPHICGPFIVSVSFDNLDHVNTENTIFYSDSIRVSTKCLDDDENIASLSLQINIRHACLGSSGISRRYMYYLEENSKAIVDSLGKQLNNKSFSAYKTYHLLLFHLFGKYLQASSLVEKFTNKRYRISELFKLFSLKLFLISRNMVEEDIVNLRNSLRSFLSLYFRPLTNKSLTNSFHLPYEVGSSQQESTDIRPFDHLVLCSEIFSIVMRKLESFKDTVELQCGDLYEPVIKSILFSKDPLNEQSITQEPISFEISIPKLKSADLKSIVDTLEEKFDTDYAKFDCNGNRCSISLSYDLPLSYIDSSIRDCTSTLLNATEHHLKNIWGFRFNVTSDDIVRRVINKVSSFRRSTDEQSSTETRLHPIVIDRERYIKQLFNSCLQIGRFLKSIGL